MSTIFTWSIKSMNCDNTLESQQNYVAFITWRCEGLQEGVKIAIESSISFAYEPTNNFIPYNELTESMVLEWVFSSLDKEVIEGSIIQQFRQHNSQHIKETSLPW
jgi:hypothetical protein